MLANTRDGYSSTGKMVSATDDALLHVLLPKVQVLRKTLWLIRLFLVDDTHAAQCRVANNIVIQHNAYARACARLNTPAMRMRCRCSHTQSLPARGPSSTGKVITPLFLLCVRRTVDGDD